jgi:hypothetical protein
VMEDEANGYEANGHETKMIRLLWIPPMHMRYWIATTPTRSTLHV